MKQLHWNKLSVIFQALLIYTWLTVLSPLSVTDTYYSVYLLCGALGLMCLYDNYKSRRCCDSKKQWILLHVLPQVLNILCSSLPEVLRLLFLRSTE